MRRYPLLLAACISAGLLTGCAQGDRRAAMVDDLVAARITGRTIPPLTLTHGVFTLDEAYRVQDALTWQLTQQTDRVAGYKVAYATAASRRPRGLAEPLYGRLLTSMEVPDGGRIDLADFHSFAIELEVAFTIGRRIDRQMEDVEELKSHVKSVRAAFELPDNRFDTREAMRLLPDIIADGVGAHRFVLGPAKSPAGVDVDAVTATMRHDGKVVRRGEAGSVMGSPWNVLLWLANALTRRGYALHPGDVVLTGALDGPHSPPRDKAAGRYVGDCGPLGRVRCTVVGRGGAE